ncbi:M3 family metallopeptidase [Undibacterium cyanobacteriorum]|uniref:oligopeptidase A n=1 Tax=Undibacterium cyanobacteriorum TaxID=3073561 RepID=A0ABY9RQ79_9BURK|nr:M3 family metallopeptidase [Undibacterium sp. 20NA77.5]WMW82136.1 M3 family metallopeptidase [Undibacterium sp. 20NA77.5]
MNSHTELNPLLDFSDLPRFDAITAEHVAPAIDRLLEECRRTVAQLEAPIENITWDNFVTPLETTTERLGRAWGIVNHLNSVRDTPELRAAYNEAQPKITEFWTALGQNLQLYQNYKALATSPSYADLSSARKKIISNALRDFKLGGAELNDDAKKRYAEIQERLAALSTRFSENLLDATNDYKLLIEDREQLKGLPEDVLQAAANAAQEDGKQGYQFTLHFPSYFPVLQYAEDRSLRETIYRANATKASELGGNAEWDNSALIDEILRLRQEEAELLGYRHYADVSLVPKMAESAEQVETFLLDLATKAKPYAAKDLSELRQFAKEQLGIDDLQAWDTTYASEKLREQRYAFSEQELKQYFQEPKVVAGLFQVIEKLFGATIREDHASTWHEDVRFFRVEREGKLVGQFYLDLYARAAKQGGAWMDDARARCLKQGQLQTPVVYLTCNFNAPVVVDGVRKPATFTHDEVITLFHEFGHGLHQLLTQVDDIAVSGISGVEWDAVELPSQFMENFCWEWDVLQSMSAHVETEQALPRSLYDKMIAAKNFQAGLQTLRQVEFALFDMRIHAQHPKTGSSASFQVAQVLQDVRNQVSVIQPPSFNRFQHSFSHIFAGGYAAGYFSYKWAEVLSADAYAAFEEVVESEGTSLSRRVGQRFQTEILEVGGSRPALESFVAFRGRKPSIDALLRHNGMNA